MGLVKRTYVDGETVITADNLNDIQDEIIQNAEDITTKGTYSKPTGGIPSTDMTTAVQTSLGKADTALQSSDIDNTLTVSGKAADAKKTGDEISDVRNTLNHKADVIYDTASGDIASFPDGADGLPVKDLTVGIEPVQDLHGYANPWPAGGGKNKLDNSFLSYAQDGLQYHTLNLKPNTAYTLSSNEVVQNVGIADLFLCEMDEGASSNTNGVWNGKAVTRTADANGNLKIAYRVYNNWITPTQLMSYQTQLEEGSTATSFAPYSNICPISGWTGANVTRAGKNLLNIDAAGAVTTPDNVQRNGLWIKINSGGAYYTVSRSGGNAVYFWYKNQSGNWVGDGLSGSTKSKTFQSYGDAFCIHAGNGTILATTTDLQLEEGSTASDYEPFGTTIPISWQSEVGTVYGGTLDVTSGVLTVDKEYVEYDGSNDESWFKYNVGSSSGFAMGLPGVASGGAAKFISNYLSYIPPEYTWGSYDGWFSNDGANLITGVKSVTTVANWRSYLQNSPLAFVKPLATPIIYQLTPTEVTTLLGQNNIWADCGPVEVEAPRDTRLYIDRKISEAVTNLLNA